MSRSADCDIHPTAVVSEQARLAPGVRVGPYAVIGPEVSIDEQTVVGPHTVIQGPTTIGRRNRIAGQAAIGTDPQDLKFRGERSYLEVGDDNRIREFVTINRGTEGGGGKTIIGSGTLLMAYAHVAHDCRVGDGVILANGATLAGHVEVGREAIVGAFSGVHQFCRVGPWAFIGGYSVITRDALPFLKTVGVRNRAKTFGVNGLGLQRKGFSAGRIEALKKAYRLLSGCGFRLREALQRLAPLAESSPDVALLVEFIQTSQRGFVR